MFHILFLWTQHFIILYFRDRDWQPTRAHTLADLEGEGVRGLQSPLLNFKESNKTKQKIEDIALEKEEERKSCMFV